MFCQHKVRVIILIIADSHPANCILRTMQLKFIPVQNLKVWAVCLVVWQVWTIHLIIFICWMLRLPLMVRLNLVPIRNGLLSGVPAWVWISITILSLRTMQWLQWWSWEHLMVRPVRWILHLIVRQQYISRNSAIKHGIQLVMVLFWKHWGIRIWLGRQPINWMSD